ncbi:glycosyltransferase [Mediterranea massiliensis]|uniref:glycosyltransferase n=1 Tax=Mediterranea massiliensis TaxID=1841865 RepID=UPI0025A4C2DF|nr:glycosyltransferase [Mediterranea massiliensis]MDM8337653.1 glycosyltransferase [Mediterranea massiliensis]
MRIVFLGGIYPNCRRDEIIKNSKRGVQFAADNFQNSFIQGLIDNGLPVKIVSLPFISSFPFGYRKLYVKGGNFEFNQKMIGEMVSYINIPFVRYRLNNLQQLLWASLRDWDDCYLIVYSLQRHLIKVALNAKKCFPKIKICLIIPDLPEYMSFNKVYTFLGLKNDDINYIYRHINKANYYVVLTKQMAERLKIRNREWICIEGIYNEKLAIDKSLNKSSHKVILYSGAIHKRYGLGMLLDAFRQINDDNFRLWICGDGDYKNEIVSVAAKDSRIKYFGTLPIEKVLELQKKATLLINPRTAVGEYTKYSFPSKTMEYLASGTPVLMYSLPGIPEEYSQYYYKIDDDCTSTRLAETIMSICNQSSDELLKFGERAASFIKTNKNAKIQVRKMLDIFH